jgi:hypothetical protein
MPYSVTYPPSGPTISGENVTVSGYLQNPTRVRRLVENLTYERFIADRLFTPGPPAVGGAVLFDQVTANDIFLARDVESIRPGQEFPILTDTAPTPKLAAIEKWGGRVYVTDEQRDRNQYDVFARETRKLANTVVRKVDDVAIATLQAAPINTFVGSDWTAATGATMIANLIDGAGAINDPDLGYVADLVLLHPTQFNELLKQKDFRDAMQANTDNSILREGIIGTFLGMTFGRSNRIAAGTGYVASSRLVGGISDEVPLRTTVYRVDGEESTFIQSGRRVVAYVTDPKAATQLTGI